MLGRILLMVGFTLVGWSVADVHGASVSGTVRSPEEDPLQGVFVTARETARGVAYTVVSGSDGAYRFEHLPDGEFVFRAHQIGRVVKFQDPQTNGEPLFTVVRRKNDGNMFDADVVDTSGSVLLRLEGYQTVELPSGADPSSLEPIRAALKPRA